MLENIPKTLGQEHAGRNHAHGAAQNSRLHSFALGGDSCGFAEELQLGGETHQGVHGLHERPAEENAPVTGQIARAGL